MRFGPLELLKRNPRTGTICYIMRVFFDVPRGVPDSLFKKPLFDLGWGNGYVVLPKRHKYYRWDYDKINSEFTHRLPEGLTHSSEITTNKRPDAPPTGMWFVGFDTMHAWNKTEVNNRDWLIMATYRLEYLLNEDAAKARRRKLKKRNVCKKK